jgi:mannose-6-phosphate isomerase-like protein (cupin superfamily)
MLEIVNLEKAVKAVNKLYVYEKIGRLNGHVLSVVNVENRTLDFHVHEDSDELFYVIEGSFRLETDDGLIPVDAGELIIVPKGQRHRPVVGELSRFLMIELDGTLNKENSGELYVDRYQLRAHRVKRRRVREDRLLRKLHRH